VDDDTLAKFLRDKAAQLQEISRQLHGRARGASVPLDDLMRLAQELRRKADELEPSNTPPPRRVRN
jgi:hypothetical protein